MSDETPNPVELFRHRLRRLREAKNLNLTDLAYKVGVTEGAIRQMETGQTKRASFAVGVRIAEVLGVTPAYLAFGDSDGREDPNKPHVVAVDTRNRWDEAEERFTRLRERVVRVENRVRHLPT